MPFVHEMPVRWGELDPYNHLNHAKYFTYCETARVVMLEEAGWSMQRLAESGFQIVVADLQARFMKPVNGGDTVHITTELVEGRRVSATWKQTMMVAEEPVFELTVTAAFTNLDGRPTRAPEGFVEAVAGL